MYLCPDCGFNELLVRNQGLKGPDGESIATASCPNCGWDGPLRRTVGVLTTERLWTSKAIGDLMLRIVTRHAAGPMVQAYEFIGLLPRTQEIPEDGSDEEIKAARDHNDLAQACRNHVMRAVFASAIEAGFEAAEEAHRFYATQTNTPLHPVIRDDGKPSAERTFGGDVVSIDEARKKAEP